MSQKRSWADTINFFPSKRQIRNIRNRRNNEQSEASSEDEEQAESSGETNAEENEDGDMSSGESISEGEQFEDERQALPGNTPWDKPKIVWHDDNVEVVVQRVAFRRQRNYIAEVKQ